MDTNINSDELSAMLNSEFLLTKARIMDKISARLGALAEEYDQILRENTGILDEAVLATTPKVSRGENYLLLPYLVLDFPRMFDHENVFAYRTMFWWGNYFSYTLHLGGKYLDMHRDRLIKNLHHIENEPFFICVSDTPWQYHFREDNYKPLNDVKIDELLKRRFIKISCKLDLKNWRELEEQGKDRLMKFLKLIRSQ